MIWWGWVDPDDPVDLPTGAHPALRRLIDQEPVSAVPVAGRLLTPEGRDVVAQRAILDASRRVAGTN